MTQENFVRLHSLQVRSLGLLIAKNLIKSFIKAFKMFKRSKETFEKNQANFFLMHLKMLSLLETIDTFFAKMTARNTNINYN